VDFIDKVSFYFVEILWGGEDGVTCGIDELNREFG
jgi:hypothetical protein